MNGEASALRDRLVAETDGMSRCRRCVAPSSRRRRPVRLVSVFALLVASLAFSAAPALALSSPGSVSSIALSRADGAVTASWDAASGATKYHVTYSSDGGGSWTLAALDHAGTSITFDADNNASYIVGARAGNDQGWSGWTNSPSAGPYTPPPPVAPPGSVSSIALSRADGAVTASWDAASGATKYHVTYSSDGGGSWTLAALDHAGTSITFDADNNASYIVGARAGNDQGWSGWTNSPSAGPYTPPVTAPPTPSSVTITRADGSLTASWPTSSGATSYHVTYSDNGRQSWQLAAADHAAAGSGTESITFDVENGKTYVVGVRAKNSAGGSGWRNSPSSAPYTPPEAGLIVQDSDGNTVTALSVPEGGEASYKVKLATQPTEDVKVCIGLSVRGNNDSDITFKDEASDVVAINLTFTPANWDTAQTVTLVAAEDDDAVNGARDVGHDARTYYAGRIDWTATEIDND